MYRRGPLSDFDISVACNYLPGSTATGFFAVVSSLTNQSDIFYIVADRLSAQSQASCRVQNKEAYNVFVYDRGEDHLPEIWPAGMQIIPLINTDGNLSSGTTEVILYIFVICLYQRTVTRVPEIVTVLININVTTLLYKSYD